MIRLIVAMDRKRGIAKQGFQPWNIPEDEKYFATMTKQFGASLLVGNTTMRVMGGPLPERTNYVLTTDKTPIEGATVVNNLEKFFKEYQGEDLWVIGGANVYSQCFELSVIDQIYVTQIEADFGCNQFFPVINDSYKLSNQPELQEQNGFIFRYEIYTKT